MSRQGIGMQVAATLLALAGAAMVTPAMAQDTPPGQRVFNQCRMCHQVGPTAKSVIGPQLNGLIGRTAGSVPGYAYSEANKAIGIVWTEAVFAEYIKNPKAKIPGTKMVYAGLKDDTQIADLTTYLKTFKADGTSEQ